MKEYIVLILRNMQTVGSDNKDDLQINMDNLQAKGKPFEVYKYNNQAEQYVRQETY